MFEKERAPSAGSSAGAGLAMARVIHVALMAGVVALALLAASGVSGSGGQAPVGAGGLSARFTVAAVIMPVLVIPIALRVRRVMMSRSATSPDPTQARLAAVVMSGALVEAVGMLGAVLWLVTTRPLPGAMVVVFSLIGLAALFPKRREFVVAADVASGSESGGVSGREFEQPETWT